MKSSLILFGILLAIFANVFADDLQCYICESEQTSACGETPDVSVLTSANCQDLSYGKSILNETEVINDILTKSVDGKIRGSPLLDSIFQQKGQRSATDQVKHICLTVALSSGDMKGTTRSCQQVPSHVKDVCDFIKQDVQAPIKVNKCKACSKNYCNSAPREGVTFLLMFVIMSTIILTNK